MTYRPLVIALTLLGTAACARVDSRRFEPGTTPGTQIRSTLGPPLREVTVSTPSEESSHWLYPDHVSFQLEGSRLVARHRPPETAENQLQYWRLRWRGHAQFNGRALGDTDSHLAERVRTLACPHEHTVVFYRPEDGRILQVTEYASR